MRVLCVYVFVRHCLSVSFLCVVSLFLLHHFVRSPILTETTVPEVAPGIGSVIRSCCPCARALVRH